MLLGSLTTLAHFGSTEIFEVGWTSDIKTHRLCLSFWRPFFYQTKVATCKCAAHTNDRSFISTGNVRADAAAKAAAAQETKETTCALVSVTNSDISPCLQSMQLFPQEQKNNNGGRLAAVSRGVYG